nr:uncharacterized protein LOC109764082 [Aegilops tauschii subsp. strangulata]
MEGVEGMMKGLKLSEEEKKGVKIRLSAKEKGKPSEAQAVGKVMSEKLAHPDAICLSLGRVWCPIKGISCKEIGVNQFLITFLQESGKRKALEDGPWMFDKDLVVVENYVPSRRPEDYLFDNIPIWVRVYNLPLGMMNAESAEDIGNIVGEFVEAGTGADGSAIGRFLCVKIRMQIDKPLMRGFTLDDGGEKEDAQRRGKATMMSEEEEDDGSWCRFEYEYLPDFCYTCGVIGHGEKDCTVKLLKGKKAQFGRWLRADMMQRRGLVDEKAWRNSGRSGSGSRNYGYSRSGGRAGSGSDSLSWRKSDSRSSGGGGDGTGEKGEEVTSPVKKRGRMGEEGDEEEGAVSGKKGRAVKESMELDVVVDGREEAPVHILSAGLQEQPRRDQ